MTPIVEQFLRTHRPLDVEEEKTIGRLALKGDVRARQRLVEHNLRFAVEFAHNEFDGWMDVEDLESHAFEGLCEAVLRYDPDKTGSKFITYAVWWIRQKVYGAAKNNNLIRLPSNMYKEMAAIRKASSQIQQEGRQHTLSEIARRSKLTPCRIVAVIETMGSCRHPISLDEPLESIRSRTLTALTRLDSVTAPEVLEETERTETTEQVETLLSYLKDREARVLRLRYGMEDAAEEDGIETVSPRNGANRTLREVSDIYGLTRERIRQIEKRSMEKLRRIATRKRAGRRTAATV